MFYWSPKVIRHSKNATNAIKANLPTGIINFLSIVRFIRFD
jgi:hypothetical protein